LCFGPDRRAHPRVGFDCPIQWGTDGTARVGWARDASETGASFSLQAMIAPAVGQTGRLVFRLDNYCEWLVDIEAVVQWCKPGDGSLCHVGVRLCSPGMSSTFAPGEPGKTMPDPPPSAPARTAGVALRPRRAPSA
jgi:hypothetical protein